MLTTRIPAEAVGPDPITSPELVPPGALFKVPRSISNTGNAVERLYCAGVGGTIEATLYALEESPEPFISGTPAPDARTFVALGTVTAAAGVLSSVLDADGNIARPPAGTLYVRVTSGAGANRALLLTLV